MLIGVSEAAKLANTTRQRIYNAIKRGDLKPRPGLPVVLLKSEDVEAFAARPVNRGGPRIKSVTPRAIKRRAKQIAQSP